MKNEPTVSKAFTLIETTLALGITAFALVAIIGLIPVGLNSVRNARDQSAAGNVLSKIAQNIRHASQDGSGNFRCTIVPGEDSSLLTWTLGADPLPPAMISDVAWDGSTSTERGRFVVRVAVTPPGSAVEPGRAEVSVAWPEHADFNASSGEWENASGKVETAISFLPKR